MKGNLLLVHGGAPTAVMNASLYGAVLEAAAHPQVDQVLGAVHGTGGLLARRFARLDTIGASRLRLLLRTPASAIGTSRDHLKPEDYQAIAGILKEQNIRWLLVNGGNGSMDTCGKIRAAVGGEEIAVVGIPKTVDNDIAVTDHAPGFGSAARYIAAITAEVARDVRSLPIHVSVIEAMGRNAGWIAAASALAGDIGAGPHLIYLPERPFDEEAFLSDVQRLQKEKGGVVVVVSEGLRDKAGEPVGKPIFQSGRSVYYGDVGSQLANLIIRRLGLKARSEKPGICGRASVAHQSECDCQEAVEAGRAAVAAALSGATGVMIGFRRLPGRNYAAETFHIPIEEVMLHERTLPGEYINPEGNGITPAFTQWCRPLIGPPLEEYFSL